MLTYNDISVIVQRIVKSYAPLAVGIFGSYATEQAHNDSDLDIFVIKQTNDPPEVRRRIVLRFAFGVLHPLDVHVFTPEEIEQEAHKEQSFVWIVVRQARVLYAVQGAEKLLPAFFKPF